MASTKRPFPQYGKPEAKNAKVAEMEPLAGSVTRQRVVLNPADCDLDFNIEEDGLQGSGLYEQGFAYCWSGARANVGIAKGKYCFGCKITSMQPVDMKDTAPDQRHVCRLGISRGDDHVRNLGETMHSFGYGGTGKFSNVGKFSDYGEKYGIGDTIVCAVNLESKSLASINFLKNGKCLGTAKCFNAVQSGIGVLDKLNRNPQWESALFPHVLLKNVVVRLQFSIEDGLVPEEGYKPWASAIEDGNAIMGPTFSSMKECEVMMMVGLPAAGKTTWAEKWVKEHPEKRYVLLGTNLALDQMKVPGLSRKHNYGERFDCLMNRATGIFNTLLSRASSTPRNFIIDQTNVYKSARKRKLKPFYYFRKIAVVVVPAPEELKTRSVKRFAEMGKEVPADAVDEMLANFTLPMSKDMAEADEFFDQVMFPEANRIESQRYLDEMRMSLKRRICNLTTSQEGSYQSRHSPMRYSRLNSIEPLGCSSMQHSGVGEELNASYPDWCPLTAPANFPTSGGFLRDDHDHYGSYVDPRRYDIQSRMQIPERFDNWCHNFGIHAADNNGANSFREVAMDGRLSAAYENYGGFTSSEVPPHVLPAPRRSTSHYAVGDTYGSSRGPPPMPSSENYSMYSNLSRGHVPLRPPYY